MNVKSSWGPFFGPPVPLALVSMASSHQIGMWCFVQPLLLMYFLNFRPSESKILASSGHDLTGPYLRHILASMSYNSSLSIPLFADLKLQRFWYLAVDWADLNLERDLGKSCRLFGDLCLLKRRQ